MSTYVRGVLTTASGVPSGYIQAINGTVNAELHQVRDETGITKVHDHFDKSREIRATVKMEGTDTIAIGDTVTIAENRGGFNGKYTVQPGSTFGEENMDSPTAEIVMLYHVDGDLPVQT